MAILVLAIFIGVPIVEIALFIEIGEWIGLWPTLAIVVLTAIAGTSLLRWQGLTILRRAQETAARNELPVAEVFDGMCLLVAGVLLLTPGFFTDTLGFLLFVPPFRHVVGMAVWRWFLRHGKVTMTAGVRYGRGPGGGGSGGGTPGGGPGRRGGSGPVIDGDYEEVDPQRAEIEKDPPPDRRGD